MVGRILPRGTEWKIGASRERTKEGSALVGPSSSGPSKKPENFE